MCIRDSHYLNLCDMNIGPQAAIVLASALTERALPSLCLLYTSDAADDTPCVDLGGRRIIKKKKQPTTP